MDIQKINSDIALIEKGLSNPNISSDMKGKLVVKITALKSQLASGVKQAEVVAEKAEDAADDEKKSLETIISKIRKGLDNKQVPESAKPALRKKLQEAEAIAQLIKNIRTQHPEDSIALLARGRNHLLNARLHEQCGHHSWPAFL